MAIKEHIKVLNKFTLNNVVKATLLKLEDTVATLKLDNCTLELDLQEATIGDNFKAGDVLVIEVVKQKLNYHTVEAWAELSKNTAKAASTSASTPNHSIERL